MANNFLDDIDIDNELQNENISNNIGQSKILNFKSIKSIKFKDPIIDNIKYRKWSELYPNDNINAAWFDADFYLSYLIHKYSSIYKTQAQQLILYDIIPLTFYDDLYHNLKLPKDSYSFNHEFIGNNFQLNGFVIHFKQLILYFDGAATYIIYSKDLLESKDTIFYTILGLIKNYKVPSIQKNKIYVVYNTHQGIKKKSFSITKHKNINLESNYNDGFSDVSKDIISKLNNKKQTGLVILEGIPGSGKTYFLRYLTSKLKKNIIFISPDMVSYITSPEFIPFLMDNSNSILIIEDAEPVLEKRQDSERTSSISNILNMTDGLLSDCLNISIIATFNTDMKNIDEALLRKGRLLKSYKFEKLNIAKSKTLLSKLGKKNINVTEPMTLSEIYNTDNNIGTIHNFERKSIGFSNKNI